MNKDEIRQAQEVIDSVRNGTGELKPLKTEFPAASEGGTGTNDSDRMTVWLVELFHNDKSEGWWVGPPKSEGGWRTDNAWAAKQYTESEARAVAGALDYFPAPFRWSHWVATEHVFIKGEYSHPALEMSAPVSSQECDCPCEICGISTGKHCGRPPCDVPVSSVEGQRTHAEQVVTNLSGIHTGLITSEGNAAPELEKAIREVYAYRPEREPKVVTDNDGKPIVAKMWTESSSVPDVEGMGAREVVRVTRTLAETHRLGWTVCVFGHQIGSVWDLEEDAELYASTILRPRVEAYARSLGGAGREQEPPTKIMTDKDSEGVRNAKQIAEGWRETEKEIQELRARVVAAESRNEKLVAERDTFEREYHDEALATDRIGEYLLPLVGTGDGTAVDAAKKAAEEIRKLRACLRKLATWQLENKFERDTMYQMVTEALGGGVSMAGVPPTRSGEG